MIISCPSCSARYVVNIDDVGHGRQVKCTRCNHSWYFENKAYEAEKKLLINEISKIENKNFILKAMNLINDYFFTNFLTTPFISIKYIPLDKSSTLRRLLFTLLLEIILPLRSYIVTLSIVVLFD